LRDSAIILIDKNDYNLSGFLTNSVDQRVEIFIWRDGGQRGPFSPTALAGSIRLGSIPPETPAWTRSDPTWRSAAEVLKSFDDPKPSILTTPKAVPVPHLQRGQSASSESNLPRPVSLPAIGLATAAIFCVLLIFVLSWPSGTSSLPPAPRDQRGANVTASAPSKGNETPSPAVGVRWAISIEEAEKCVLMARSDDGSGTAFIAMDGDKSYVYTNVHVASSRSLEFSDFRGRTVSVSPQGQVVGKPVNLSDEPGIDIVRFPLIESPEFSLRFASREIVEKRPEVWTLGDSGGERILKTLRGHVKGVGPAKIEVDCEFIQGNSGGPIVTSRGEVVGIASYMTTDQTIWAKGTEQEIRRIAWIPGRDHIWIETSLDQLANERALVQECNVNSALIWSISRLETTEEGFQPPDDFPEGAQALLTMTIGHPLRNGLDEIGEILTESTRAGGSTQYAQHLEFVRFFDSCSAIQESQLDKTERKVRSSFWRKELDKMLKQHRDLLEFFQRQSVRYRESGRIGGTLNDA
jgi:Trypsin-like peptidase domain/GYF domain 2